MIRTEALVYAEQYAAHEEALHSKGDGRSSIHYPALFLFLGDKVSAAIEPVLMRCERKWDNAAGVLALHAGTHGGYAGSQDAGGAGLDGKEQPLSGSAAWDYKGQQPIGSEGWDHKGRQSAGGSRERVMTMALPDTAGRDPRTVRQDVYREFHEDGRYLAGMNRTLRQIGNRIADYGRLYSSFDVIHLSIITRVDDPLNVLLPEVALLARAVLSQSFKSVQTDLYTLINEREQGDNFGYSSSVGLAFLRELEGMQLPDYTFKAPLLVTEDGLSIPVAHGPSALFDLVYLLSDKNERGMTPVNGMEDNYEIIAHISLLKNRVRPSSDQASGHGGYNNMTFKSGIRGSTGRQGYASAGFSAVRRPSKPIAMAVLYHAFHVLAAKLQTGGGFSLRDRQALLGLTPEALRERAAGLLPDEAGIAEMTGLMSHGRPSYSELKPLSLREAEALLFGDGGEAYFRSNFADVSAARAAALDPAREWAAVLAAQEQTTPPVTFYQLAEWTAEQGEAGGSVLNALRQHMGGLRSALASAEEELEQLYAQSVERQPFQRVPLLDKRTVRNFIHYLFESIYSRKYEILRLKLELDIALRYDAALEQLHAESRAKVQTMQALEEELRSLALASIGRSGEAVDQNIMEYYRTVTAEVMLDIETRRGPGIFFSDRFMGSISELLRQGGPAVVRRLIEVCRRELLTAAPFVLPFEEELLRRANVAAAYENREIVSREELFKQLYLGLEDGAAINVRLFEYTQEHRHEEKYFFGDSSSEFLRYALNADGTTRIYRLGVVHEQRRSGVEKLNLMGGFHLEDLLYYRNGKVYYETYVQNGYKLHGVNEEQLPELR
ncbi:transcription initiation factor TFIID [Paenibacillus sp. DMB5]|uniref:transcription initiation factor TFIID n=1 Tax=Paenibacillus sp. DMB5 TaxID=1780103 RepID=UPI00076C5082|nr:transcription initiation factor TFIID [Paenibacillus sp. DMB5]KUP25593.1 transcription initiation factor TFIID [Paenibacillus sp. DMB5]